MTVVPAVALTAANGAPGVQFGRQVSVQGGLVAVAAPGRAVKHAASTGAVMLFELDNLGKAWAKVDELTADSPSGALA